MTQSAPRKPILLLGAYGRGNAGDDVFILSAAALFADRILYINSANNTLLPRQVRAQIETISTVSPLDILKKIKLFLSIHEVVYWGGDLWVELYGTRAPRQLLYKMVATNVLLRLSGKKIYYIGCGIGDLTGYSRWLARLSGHMAQTIVVRERRSAQVLGLHKVRVLRDLAINLPYHRSVMHTFPAKRPFSIVISVLWSVPDPIRSFPKLMGAIADLLNSLPVNQFKVTLLPMHITGEVHDDLWASEQLARHLKHHVVDIHITRDLPSIITLLAESDLVIGGRLHANILAMLNATPAIGISYRPKVRSFFAYNNLDEYCLGIDDLDKLSELFWTIYDNYADVSKAFYAASKNNLSRRTDYAALVHDL
jgi:polysaccharide pyruvyl transferase WcaK-like protein